MTEVPEDGTFAVGVDLGGTNLKVALVERDAGIVRRTSVETDADDGPDRVLDRIADEHPRRRRGAARRCAPRRHRRRRAGLGDDGPHDGALAAQPARLGHGPRRPSAPGRASTACPLDGPIRVENDANVAGLGSAFYGVGAAYPTFIMVTLGTGMGGAIIVDGRLFRGTTGAAGEIGHISIDYEGPPSRAGVAGAAEAYLGQRFLSRHARYQIMNRESTLHETWGDDLLDITPHALYVAAKAGDAPAREALAWAGHKLGVALGSAVNLWTSARSSSAAASRRRARSCSTRRARRSAAPSCRRCATGWRSSARRAATTWRCWARRGWRSSTPRTRRRRSVRASAAHRGAHCAWLPPCLHSGRCRALFASPV